MAGRPVERQTGRNQRERDPGRDRPAGTRERETQGETDLQEPERERDPGRDRPGETRDRQRETNRDQRHRRDPERQREEERKQEVVSLSFSGAVLSLNDLHSSFPFLDSSFNQIPPSPPFISSLHPLPPSPILLLLSSFPLLPQSPVLLSDTVSLHHHRAPATQGCPPICHVPSTSHNPYPPHSSPLSCPYLIF